jgi:hypothetical protein
MQSNTSSPGGLEHRTLGRRIGVDGNPVRQG